METIPNGLGSMRNGFSAIPNGVQTKFPMGFSAIPKQGGSDETLKFIAMNPFFLVSNPLEIDEKRVGSDEKRGLSASSPKKTSGSDPVFLRVGTDETRVGSADKRGGSVSNPFFNGVGAR